RGGDGVGGDGVAPVGPRSAPTHGGGGVAGRGRHGGRRAWGGRGRRGWRGGGRGERRGGGDRRPGAAGFGGRDSDGVVGVFVHPRQRSGDGPPPLRDARPVSRGGDGVGGDGAAPVGDGSVPADRGRVVAGRGRHDGRRAGNRGCRRSPG